MKQVLIYDEDNMIYTTGVVNLLDISLPEPIETTSITSLYRTYAPSFGPTTIKIETYDLGSNDSIKLDPTMMKRIAKYNKEVEIKKLDEIIEKRKKEIEELNDILEDKSKRVDKIKKYIAEIYDISVDDEDEDYDYDDYDY